MRADNLAIEAVNNAAAICSFGANLIFKARKRDELPK